MALLNTFNLTDIWFDDNLITKWDEVEYHPCRTVIDEHNNEKHVEQCEPEDAEFWSVYLHDIEGGIYCIADVATEEQAQMLSKLIEKAAQLYTPEH